MLHVRAIKKFHNAKGILLGYRIKDEATGQEMDVYKEQLKSAIVNNQCVVTNMTLTSDGRLIGRAAPAPKTRSKVELLEVYTNGRNLVAGLTYTNTSNGKQYNGLDVGQSFDFGAELTEGIKRGKYSNISIVDGKPDMSNVRRKSFSKVKNKITNLLKNNGVIIECQVLKTNTKFEYTVKILGYESIKHDEPLIKALFALMQDICITERIRILKISGDTLLVTCASGISDVRSAFEKIKL